MSCELVGRLCVENVSFSDHSRSELRRVMLRLRGETFICCEVVRLEKAGGGDVVELTNEP